MAMAVLLARVEAGGWRLKDEERRLVPKLPVGTHLQGNACRSRFAAQNGARE
jgi:hypothetical protein